MERSERTFTSYFLLLTSCAVHIREATFKKLLMESGLVDEESFATATQEATRSRRTITNVLIGRGDISEEYMGELLTAFLGVPYVDLRPLELKPEIVEKIPESIAKTEGIILFELSGDLGRGKLAMLDPGDLATVSFIEAKLGVAIEPYLTTESSLHHALRLYKRRISEEFNKIIEENIKKTRVETGGTVSLARMAQDLPIISLFDSIIEHSITLDASDVHFEPLEDKLLIRYRIDGIMREVLTLPKAITPIIVARVKVITNLEIDEHFKPQDGRFSFQIEDEAVDIRVSVMPVFFGEKVEMRILRGAARPLNLTELGFADHDLVLLKDEIKKTHGMILATGPTGSGKTTTLYAILYLLNVAEVNITTIEDPIEYSIGRVNQTQVNVKAGITFATGLRSLLRQNPDIIMVGEIRDDETADIAVHSALTGHLVLSSLHTNDAPTALPRFIDMGVQPFLIATTVNVVVAQRLVRKICSSCVSSFGADEMTKQLIAAQLARVVAVSGGGKVAVPELLFRGKGCKVCAGSGYRGQTGIFEVMRMSETLKDLVIKNAPVSEVRTAAIKEGMTTMFQDGMRKVESGVTSIEEVLRVIRE